MSLCIVVNSTELQNSINSKSILFLISAISEGSDESVHCCKFALALKFEYDDDKIRSTCTQSCAFVVPKPPKTGFLATRPICNLRKFLTKHR